MMISMWSGVIFLFKSYDTNIKIFREDKKQPFWKGKAYLLNQMKFNLSHI